MRLETCDGESGRWQDKLHQADPKSKAFERATEPEQPPTNQVSFDFVTINVISEFYFNKLI
jgi:hypothetical protein